MPRAAAGRQRIAQVLERPQHRHHVEPFVNVAEALGDPRICQTVARGASLSACTSHVLAHLSTTASFPGAAAAVDCCVMSMHRKEDR